MYFLLGWRTEYSRCLLVYRTVSVCGGNSPLPPYHHNSTEGSRGTPRNCGEYYIKVEHIGLSELLYFRHYRISGVKWLEARDRPAAVVSWLELRLYTTCVDSKRRWPINMSTPPPPGGHFTIFTNTILFWCSINMNGGLNSQNNDVKTIMLLQITNFT